MVFYSAVRWRCWLVLSFFYSVSVIANQNDEFKMGFYFPSIIQIASRADILVSLNFWSKELVEGIDVKIADAVLYDDIELMAEAFAKQEISLAVAPPLSIALHFDRSLLGECFVPSRGDRKLDSILVITQHEIDSIKALRGKKLLMPENDELADIFVDKLTLDAANLPFTKFFSSITKNNKINRMVLDVFFKKADIAVVNAGTYEIMLEMNPQLADTLKVIASYPQRAKNFSFIHKNYPKRQLIKDNFIAMTKSARGAQLLNVYQQQAVETCDVKELEALEKLYGEHKALLQKKETPYRRKAQ